MFSVDVCVWGGALGGRRERSYAHFCRHRPWLTVFHYYSRMLAVAIAEGKRVVLVETLKARRDIHHFLLYFISQRKLYGLTSCQGDGEGTVLLCVICSTLTPRPRLEREPEFLSDDPFELRL